jgi:hypothetical protein
MLAGKGNSGTSLGSILFSGTAGYLLRLLSVVLGKESVIASLVLESRA